jgi:hypothetical protein
LERVKKIVDSSCRDDVDGRRYKYCHDEGWLPMETFVLLRSLYGCKRAKMRLLERKQGLKCYETTGRAQHSDKVSEWRYSTRDCPETEAKNFLNQGEEIALVTCRLAASRSLCQAQVT